MNLILFIKQAFLSLKANKLRSFLSTLWVIIWILSFVIMLSFWEWAKKSTLENFWWEWNLIKVSKTYNDVKIPKINIFKEDFIDEIPKKVPNIEKSIANFETPSFQIFYKWTNVDWGLKVVAKNYFSIKKAKIILWTVFSKEDFEKNANIAIIWYKIVRSTFGEENPIWKNIIIWWYNFKIAWVLEEKWWNFDNYIFIPNTSSKKLFWNTNVTDFDVYAKDELVVDEAMNYLKIYLSKKTWVENIDEANFSISSNKEFLKQIWEFSKMFSYFLIWIWAISLIVWWIWIMNIMLVSVTERTREIWIKKAIWATNFNIMLQFLIESIILTLVWSLIAIIFSYLIVWFANWFLKEALQMEILINSKVLITAISVSITMWIIFGIMPAYKAARLKPVEALYFE